MAAARFLSRITASVAKGFLLELDRRTLRVMPHDTARGGGSATNYAEKTIDFAFSAGRRVLSLLLGGTAVIVRGRAAELLFEALGKICGIAESYFKCNFCDISEPIF